LAQFLRFLVTALPAGGFRFLLGATVYQPVWYSRLIEYAVRLLFVYSCFSCIIEPLSKMLVLTLALVKLTLLAI